MIALELSDGGDTIPAVDVSEDTMDCLKSAIVSDLALALAVLYCSLVTRQTLA